MVAANKAKAKTLLDKMEQSLSDLVADMDSTIPKQEYSLTDRMKIYDRIVNLEKLKQGIDDKSENSGFSED